MKDRGGEQELLETRELSAIRNDLQAIRGCLLSSGLGDAQEMACLLRSTVQRFRTWTSVGPIDCESVKEIQRELGELQPLFENAYALHAGWFGLLDLNEAQGSDGYNGAGQQAKSLVRSSCGPSNTIVHRG